MYCKGFIKKNGEYLELEILHNLYKEKYDLKHTANQLKQMQIKPDLNNFIFDKNKNIDDSISEAIDIYCSSINKPNI